MERDYLRLTGGRGGGRGGSCKVTAPGHLALSLEVAVNGIVAVVLDGVRLVAGPILEDGAAVGSSPTGVVQGFLQNLITQPIFA